MNSAFYAADLAYIHDAGYSDFARGAAPWVARRLARLGRSGTRVVEIGCGSGALTQSLVMAGHRVAGIDVSRAMIRLARLRAPEAGFRVASWQEFTLPSCDAIVAVGECFNYLSTDPRAHRKALNVFLRRAGKALRPGGILLFDFLEPSPGIPPRRRFHRCGRDWAVVVEVHDRRNLITRHITSVRLVAGGCRCTEETHRQLRLSRARIEQALRAAGFAVRFRRGYGRTALGKGRVVVDAKRADRRVRPESDSGKPRWR